MNSKNKKKYRKIYQYLYIQREKNNKIFNNLYFKNYN